MTNRRYPSYLDHLYLAGYDESELSGSVTPVADPDSSPIGCFAAAQDAIVDLATQGVFRESAPSFPIVRGGWVDAGWISDEQYALAGTSPEAAFSFGSRFPARPEPVHADTAAPPVRDRADGDALQQIDRAIDGLCPCGAPSRPDSVYCSYDCVPNHTSIDTDRRGAGAELATPMRWRPDLVTAVDDTDLIPLGSQTYYDGPPHYRAQLFQRGLSGNIWHLRLDDGHRFVGVDYTLREAVPVVDTLRSDLRAKWATLVRELGNGQYAEPATSAQGAFERLTDHHRRATFRAGVISTGEAQQPIPVQETRWASVAAAVIHRSVFFPLPNTDMSAGITGLFMQRLQASAPAEPAGDSVTAARERALEFRRNRNTGPSARPRPPRRLDPRGGR